MLSRTANDLLWMSRLVERAENTARILDVTYRMSLLPYKVLEPGQEWAEPWVLPLVSSGLATTYYERHKLLTADDVIHFMALDASNPSSIYCCLRDARENARAQRGAITSEMWESLNTTWIEMRNMDFADIKANGIGFGATGHVAMESRVQTVLKDMFRPEFLNRIDETIVFHELEKSEIRRIVDLMLTEVKLHLAEKGLALEVTEPAKDLLAEKGYDPKYGARPLRKTIQRLVEDPLADMLLTGKFVGFGIVRVGVDESGATLTFETVLQPAVETDPAA